MLLPRGVPPPQPEGGRLAGDTEEEEELEEGEARPDDSDDDFFDPDIALSYIDEKIHHVLGHFQKEFEGGISADNLGPKFGGYGSFLPTYQHSPPLLPQTRSSHAATNIITSRSPCQPSAERMDRDLSAVAVQSISRNNGSITPSNSDLCKNERFSSTNSEESVAVSDSLDRSNNVLSRKNAAIYSGLGLDISSSSSMEESPDRLGGPYESPRTILQVMTCFQVPGGFMLSPLHDNVLRLANKVTPLLKKTEEHLSMKNVPKEFEGHLQSSISPGHFRGFLANQFKFGSKKAESHKDLGEHLPNRCEEDMEQVLMENRSAKGELWQKERTVNTINENDFDVTSARKDIPTSVNAPPVPATVVTKDHWVCCDSCQKWRLLPYGTSPSMLPKKWKCSMLYWLPGMNRCDISEDETTNALNALYLIPAPAIGVSSGGPHTAGGDIAILSAQNISAQLDKCGEKKTSPGHGNGLNESSYHTPLETPPTCNEQNSKKQERIVDYKNDKFEKDSVSKDDLMPMSKSANLLYEKQKSEKGDLKERTRVHSNLKTKREIDQDKHKTFKKTRKEDQHQINRVWEHECDSVGGEVSGEPKAFPAEIKSMKGSLQTGDIPLRKEKITSAYEKLCAKIDGTVNTNSGTIHSPVKYSRTEVGDECNGQVNIEESQAAVKPIFHGSLQGNSDSSNKEIAQSGRAQLSDITCLKKVCDNNLPKATWRRDFPKTGTGVGTGAAHLSSSDKKGWEMERPSHHAGLNAIALENKTSACRGSGQKLVFSFDGEEKSKPRISEQDIQKPAAQYIHLPVNEGKQEVCSTSVKFDASQMEALSRRPNVRTGVQHVTVRQEGLKHSDASPVGKDGSMVAFALKEARDLKHKANHLKNKGLELESTGLYFEAALKFLHVAFLLETPTFDSSRPGDTAESMKMYSETAKLCKFCAHQYERSKNMAAAALAYKCVEVAYLKAAYYKNPSARKDRRELQAVAQIDPGESSSSFARDTDNINGHGLSKNSSTKDGNSPQVVANNLPLAVRNQAHLLRLLAYQLVNGAFPFKKEEVNGINDVNGAFDATRKSQLAIVSAIGIQGGKGMDDGLASVKTVLDFNFCNVNELLRLVRLSMESISI
ncbi:hypothetical protein EJB05_06633 [Eragrostis curvula]|uniref:CW-type domain-containing protein n=1 Tax=Eragrostis curvula TaxID=38414 RepID=A0A5J9WGH5_9POAL|nr:hypothetical protein EJB05_06633 [Eragrostis curvula]